MTACSICGHPAKSCGHTEMERRRHIWLESRIIQVPPILVDAAVMKLADDSYSGDVIDPEHDGGTGKIRRPFYFGNRLWVATGGGPGKYQDCYIVVPRNQFKEKVRHMSDYYKCTEDQQDELWRYVPMGFYHGIVARNGKQEYVLVGPETRFALNGETTANQI